MSDAHQHGDGLQDVSGPAVHVARVDDERIRVQQSAAYYDGELPVR